jgi:hypothetical protein
MKKASNWAKRWCGNWQAVPDFLARLRKIYGEKALEVSGAELIS